MQILKKMLKQQAIWWSRTGSDQHGEATFADPVQIKCRWEDVVSQYKPMGGGPGDVALSSATVYVDRDIKEGDYLQLASLESSTDNEPHDEEGAREVVTFEKLPTLSAKQFLRTARL